MRLPEGHLNATAFLCVEEKGRTVPRATAFFVIDRSGPGWHPIWVVTARHCIQEIRASRQGSYLRVNTADSFIDIPTAPDDWHESADHDVAAALFFAPPEAVVTTVPLDQFVAADYTYKGDVVLQLQRAHQVLVGHEVFFVGLFSQHWGQERNLPIARFGAISRMPREKIRVQRADGSERILGYLIEARSWGGHSGSPVFWNVPLISIHQATPPGNREQRRKSKPIHIQDPEARLIALLGLVSAHFDIDQEIKGGDMIGATAAINSGVMVVTPAAAIRELLESEDIVEERERYQREIDDEQPAASYDMAQGVDIAEGIVDDSEYVRFEDLTSKLVNVPKSEIDEKRKDES
jgi:hypothetical protein